MAAAKNHVSKVSEFPSLTPMLSRRIWGTFAAAVAVSLLFLSSVHFFLSPGGASGEPGLQISPAPNRKLFVFIIDGMRPEDARDPRLTFLEPFRKNGFFAEIQPCLECLTVPCVSEAFTGTASAGLLGAYHNLVSASDVSSSSLFADVVASGRRTALVHEGQYAGFSRWLTFHYRGKKEWTKVQSYLKEGVDLIVWHYPHLDEMAHHAKVGTPKYLKALDKVDQDAQKLLAVLPPEYRFVVVGDHGHTSTGRHIFGLDIPTAFLSDGELFGTEPVAGRLPLSTYRFLLGAELGILPPHEYEGTDLADRLPVGSAIRAAAEGRPYVGPRRSGVTPTRVVLAALVVAVFALRVLPAAVRGWAAVGIGLALVGGYFYLPILPTIHYSRPFHHLLERILGCVGFVGAMGYAWRRDWRVLLITSLLVVIALPGTLYNYGAFQMLPHLIFATTLVLTVPRRWFAGERRTLILPVLGLVVAWYFLGDVNVGTFAIRSFPRIKYELPVGILSLAWAGLAAAFARGWRARCAAALVAGLAASGRVDVAGYPLAAISLAIAVAAVRFPTWLPVVGAFAALDWYGRSFGTGVVVCVLFAASSARLAWDDERLRAWFVPLVTVATAYLSLAMSGQLRTNGLDFDFAIAWLPGDLHVRLWPIVAIALVLKIFLAPMLVVLGVQRFAGDVDASPMGVAVSVRLAGIAAAVAGLLVQTAAPPRYRIFEQLEDMIAWLFVLAVVLLTARRNPYRAG